MHAYADIRHELEGLSGEINGEFGELDWMPVRYIHRTLARRRLPGLYRAGRVALVTPLRDGMNLVAKEFIAAQDPYDTGATADAVQRALRMPLGERRQRHQALLSRIREHDVHWWRLSFLRALEEAERATD